MPNGSTAGIDLDRGRASLNTTVTNQGALSLALIPPLLVRVFEDSVDSAGFRLGLLALAFLVTHAWRAVFSEGRLWQMPAGEQFSFALLFTIMLPAPVGWGGAILSTSFGWVFGREIFGDKAILSPGLVALAFAIFSFPQGGYEAQSIFSTPTNPVLVFACLPGAAWLLWRRFLAWQTFAGALLGVAAASLLLTVPGAPAWWQHYVLGGYFVGVAFLAAAPGSAPDIPLACWLHGAVVGTMIVVFRLFNPVQPDGVVFAVLIGALFAPLLDRALIWRTRRE